VFNTWWRSVTADEGGRVQWWQKAMADEPGLPNYTIPNRVVSFDQFAGSSLQEEVLGK